MSSSFTLAFLAIIFAALAAACEANLTSTAGETSNVDQSLELAEVVRVIDGDTIIVRVNGEEERLRYIGIDTPESSTPDRPIECYGPEADDENRRLVTGQQIFLESDVEDRDRFGRLLRYVYIELPDGSLAMVNVLLVERGYAEAGSFPPNERYNDELFAAERRASANRVGLWGACN